MSLVPPYHRRGMPSEHGPFGPQPFLMYAINLRRALNSFSNPFSTTVGMMKDN